MVLTKDEMVAKEIATWGVEYVEDLFDKGYEPTLVGDENGVKWIWLLTARVPTSVK